MTKEKKKLKMRRGADISVPLSVSFERKAPEREDGPGWAGGTGSIAGAAPPARRRASEDQPSGGGHVPALVVRRATHLAEDHIGISGDRLRPSRRIECGRDRLRRSR